METTPQLRPQCHMLIHVNTIFLTSKICETTMVAARSVWKQIRAAAGPAWAVSIAVGKLHMKQDTSQWTSVNYVNFNHLPMFEEDLYSFDHKLTTETAPLPLWCGLAVSLGRAKTSPQGRRAKTSPSSAWISTWVPLPFSLWKPLYWSHPYQSQHVETTAAPIHFPLQASHGVGRPSASRKGSSKTVASQHVPFIWFDSR